ncbi:MAG: stage 0 sporulation family protein [Desulfomonilaceae bacterium]
MDSDKTKKSYLPRSWGTGREEKREDSSVITGDIQNDSPKNDSAESDSPKPVLQSSRDIGIVSDQHDQSEKAEAGSDEDVSTKARILEVPTKASSSAQTIVEDADSDVERVPETLLDTEYSGSAPEYDNMAHSVAHVQRAEDKRPRRVKINIVGVRFAYACKVYRFDSGDLELKGDDWVIVKTEKGLGLGRVALPPSEHEIDASQLEGLRKVIRKAGKVDFDQKARLLQKEREAYTFCLERIDELGLPMKLVGVDCFFDGSKYVFFFTAEGRVDFRELVKQLVVRFPVRIEMRQIGVRHEAKMTGGIACCGQELCCSRFLTDFRPVSVKMAKAQNLSLNPTKISGVCGRLMCCLGYEHEIYEQFRKGLPKVGRVVVINKGQGVVTKHNALAETVSVRLEDETVVEVTKEDILEIIGTSQRSNNEPDEADADNFCDSDDEKDSLEFNEEI